MTTKESPPVIAKVITALLTATVALALWAVAPAQAEMEIQSFTTDSSDTQAGGHPDLSTSFRLTEPGVSEAARSVTFNAPEGVFGNPAALVRCTSADFALQECAPTSQAGLITIYANYEGDADKLLGTTPIFNMSPGPDQTALFAFVVPILDVPIQIPVAVRTGSDFGLRFTVAELTQTAPLAAADLTFWGYPSSSTHTAQRFPKGSPGKPPYCAETVDTGCISGVPSNLPDAPLIDNPTICTQQSLIANLEVRTYQDPAHPLKSFGTYPATTGCLKEVFKPVLFANLTTNETDSATGLDLKLQNPQFFGFSPTPSQLRSAIITMPPELTINPDAADGQTACSESQANFGTEAAAQCPNNSKIGTFRLNTPALEGPLTGAIYIGEPKPGNQYRLFLTADGFGVHAKLVGSAHPHPETGQLTVSFLDLPQAPFDDFQIHLFSSDRGLFATPKSCTVYPISGQFFPWNAALADVVSEENVSLSSGPGGSRCPGQIRPFEPALQAGTNNPVAGAHSSFTLKLDREDGDQYLGKLDFTMPPGLTANLRGVAYCPESAIAAAAQNAGVSERDGASCPATSQIGTSNVAAGPGSHPFHAYGDVYLAGAFQGAPMSLVAVTPALAGPYDYGTVVVRVALHIDPLDAHVFADSEVVPKIIGGIPLRMRSIQVNIDKPNFMINPTNCSPFAVVSHGIGDQGSVVEFSSPFAAVNCTPLPFKPKMTVRVEGRRGIRRATNPQLGFRLTTRPGDANIKALSVTLPKAFQIDQSHLGNICSEKELVTKQCQGRTAIGSATTSTPLLDQSLTGPVYAVSGSGGLPRLAFILNGQVNLIPRAETKSVNGRLKTTVPVVPDAAIGEFKLRVFGGKTGYLANTRGLCGKRPQMLVEFLGQNGKALKSKVKVKVPCGKSK